MTEMVWQSPLTLPRDGSLCLLITASVSEYADTALGKFIHSTQFVGRFVDGEWVDIFGASDYFTSTEDGFIPNVVAWLPLPDLSVEWFEKGMLGTP